MKANSSNDVTMIPTKEAETTKKPHGKQTASKNPIDSLKFQVDNSSKALLKCAARIAEVLEVENNKIQPEFIFVASLRSTSGPCKELTDLLENVDSDLRSYALVSLCEIYRKSFPEISDRLQSSRVPKSFCFSNDTKKILASANKKWRDRGQNRPLPVDYILAALFTRKEPLDVLDSILGEYAITRQDLFDALTSTSAHFSYEPEYKPEPKSAVNVPTRASRLEELDELQAFLLNHVIGQDQAISCIMQSLRRTSAGLKPPNKPIGIFLFAGYTGVGKTEVARQLAIGTKRPLLRIDMSEYSEKHTASRLYGSPPGYIGYDEGGQLTGFVQRNSNAIIVFDELEKAHPDIFDKLLQIAEEAELTDARGTVAKFDNCIIILTTNTGSREATSQPLGFNTPVSSNTSVFDKAIKQQFKPELLGRIGRHRTVIFNRLSTDDILQITRLKLIALAVQCITSCDIRAFDFSENVRDHIIASSNVQLYGARDISSTVDQEFVPHLSDFLLATDLPKNCHISVDHDSTSGYSFTIKKR